MKEFNFGQIAVTIIEQTEKMPEIAGFPAGTAVRYYGNGTAESDYYERKIASIYRVFTEPREDVRLNVVFGVQGGDIEGKTAYVLCGEDIIQQMLDLNAFNKKVFAFVVTGAGITDEIGYASAFGAAVSKLFLLTDYRVYALSTGRVYDGKWAQAVRREIMTASNNFSPSAVAEIALKMSGLKNFPLITGGERQMERVIVALFAHEQRKELPFGVIRLICAATLNRVCKYFLLTDFGMVEPPDNNLRLEEISDYLGLSEKAALQSLLLPIGEKKLSAIKYSLNFYKSELLAELCFNELVFKRALIKLKKMLPACGFKEFGSLDASDLRLALALSPDLSCGTANTFTGIMKTVGVLDNLL